MNIVGHTWFTNPRGNIGIVVYETESHVKAKISIVSGNDMENDIAFVIHHGSTFPIMAALLLLREKVERMAQFRELGIDLEEFDNENKNNIH